MKRIVIVLWLFLFSGACLAAGEHMHHGDAMGDQRVSLGLSPEMKQHQLSNMRAHLEAIHSIIGLIAKKEFSKASEVAYSKLGLTEEMKQMCDMFSNEDFKKLGMAFHKSGDVLGEVLLKKNATQSLHALSNTMGYCVECHAAFRQ
ncbi:MAG: cytochrome C [Gallionellaceae bacterium]|jgi:hypothetical protein|nr:cytochrome C [Gallionellaceae bacterium]